MITEWLMLALYILGMFIMLLVQQDRAEQQARPWLPVDSFIVVFWPVELVVWTYQTLRERWRK